MNENIYAVINKTKNVFKRAKQQVQSTIEQSRIQRQINRFKQLEEYRNVIETKKRKLEKTSVNTFIDSLGRSPTELFDKSVRKIKHSFPIPTEQTILWAYVIKDTNRDGGIVVTEYGVFIKTIVNVFEENALKKENKKASELFYYPWDILEAELFFNTNYIDPLVLFFKKNTQTFINACKKYEDLKNNKKIKISNFYSEQVVNGDSVSVSASLLKGVTKFTRDNGYGNNPRAGFGLFAEQANNMADKARFKKAKVVGGDNAKNGPDRLVNGVRIQTKYYATGRRSVEATFDNKGTGNYRYYNPDGTPMKLEVPKGQYDSAVKTFKKKIVDGKVPGVSNPSEAERIIVEGHYTYEQSIRISKAGTIDSLYYDLKTGTVATTCVFGISFLINSYICYRKNHNHKEAVIEGLIAGGKAGALTMSTHVLVSQLSRTSFFSNIMTKQLIKSGAVNAIGGFAVFSIPETYNYATKKISRAQYIANLAVLSGSIIGGTAGAYLGSSIAGVAGGVIGGMTFGAAAGIGVSKIADIIYESDVKRLTRLFNAILLNMINEYLLEENEIDELIGQMNLIPNRKFGNLFKSIQSSNEQVETIKEFLKPYFDTIVNRREKYIPALEYFIEN